MAKKVSPTKAQSDVEKMVALYNMGMLSRKFLMNHYHLATDADSSKFWQRHRRTVDQAKASIWVRVFGA